MTLITLPNTLTPGTTENVTHVQENDAAIVTVVNGNLDATNLATGAVTPIKTGVIPCARAYNSIDQSVASAETTLTFDSERYDTDGIHSTVSNTGRLTATTAGLYAIKAHIKWASTPGINAFLAIRLNGTTYIARTGPVASGGLLEMTISTDYVLAASDYVEVRASSTSTLNVTAAPNYSPEFMMHWVGKAV